MPDGITPEQFRDALHDLKPSLMAKEPSTSSSSGCRVCGGPIVFSRRAAGKDTCSPRCEYPAWPAEVAAKDDRIANLEQVSADAVNEATDLRALLAELDGAWGTVWLDGNWRWLTKNMTTEQREAAAAAVQRWAVRNDPQLGAVEDEHLRWWRY